MSVPSRAARHEAWMRRALEVASPVAFAVASPVASPVALPGGSSGDEPDVPIGAVILGPDGEELASARNERELTGDPTAHAEILALRRATAARGADAGSGGWRLDGCTLIVTVEPCTMCAGAMVLARVSTLVFGAWEPKTGAVGSLWDVVRDPRLNHRLEVYPGVLAEECGALLREFFVRQRST